MVQTVPVLQRAVARKLVLRVWSTTSTPTPRSLVQPSLVQTHSTLESWETHRQPVGTPPPSTTTLASNIKCRRCGTARHGVGVWLLVGIEPASAPVEAVPMAPGTAPEWDVAYLQVTTHRRRHRGEAVSAFRAGPRPAPLVAGVPAVRLREISVAVSRDRPASGGQQLSTRCLADMFGLNEPIRLLGIASGGND